MMSVEHSASSNSFVPGQISSKSPGRMIRNWFF
jgi:hypothetical protein